MSGGRVDFAAGRGYDRREYEPLGANFDDNQSVFEEGMEIVRRLWNADGPVSHHGKHYRFDEVLVTPQPIQRPLPAYVGSFSRPSIERSSWQLGWDAVSSSRRSPRRLPLVDYSRLPTFMPRLA